MRTLLRHSIAPVILAAAVQAAACGKSSTVSPTAPSTAATGSAAAPAPAPTPVSRGATLSGVVEVGAVPATALLSPPSMIRALGSGAGNITVSVTGTPISTITGPDGTFLLQNVPPGDLTLSITGNGISARVAVLGVEADAQVRITVRVSSAGTAEVADGEKLSDGKVEIEGLVVSVTGSTLVVGQRSVIVPPGTPIQHGNTDKVLADLLPGVRVHIKATRAGDVVTATRITLQNAVPHSGNGGSDDDDEDDDDDDDDELDVEFTGAVSGAIGGTCPQLTFIVAGTTVKTNLSTRFDGVTCTTLKSGDTVEVEGTKQADLSVLAKDVDKQSTTSDGPSSSGPGSGNKGGNSGKGNGKN